MQLDRPRRAGNSFAKLARLYYIVVHERLHPSRLPRLPDADLHPAVVDEARFTSRDVVAEETCVFANLQAALHLGIGKVRSQQSVELAAVRTDDPSAVAQQLAGSRGGEQPYLRARQAIAFAVAFLEQLGDARGHDRVVAILAPETRRIDSEHSEDHRWILHPTLITDERREPCHRNDVGVPGCIDDQLCAYAQPALLRPGDSSCHMIALEQDIDDQGMEQYPDARVAKQIIGGVAPHQRIVDARKRLPISHRWRKAVPAIEETDELVGESKYHLSGTGRGVVRCLVQPADRSRHPSDGATPTKSVALDERYLQSLSRRCHGGRDSSGAASCNEDVGGYLDRVAAVHCLNGCHISPA